MYYSISENLAAIHFVQDNAVVLQYTPNIDDEYQEEKGMRTVLLPDGHHRFIIAYPPGKCHRE